MNDNIIKPSNVEDIQRHLLKLKLRAKVEQSKHSRLSSTAKNVFEANLKARDEAKKEEEEAKLERKREKKKQKRKRQQERKKINKTGETNDDNINIEPDRLVAVEDTSDEDIL